MCFSLGADAHCSEFENHETTSSIPDTFLTIKNRSRRREPNPRHEQDHERHPDWQREKNAGEVENSFPPRDAKKLRAVQLGVVKYPLWIGPWKSGLRRRSAIQPLRQFARPIRQVRARTRHGF